MSDTAVPTTIKGVRIAPKGEQPPARVDNIAFSADTLADDEVLVRLQEYVSEHVFMLNMCSRVDICSSDPRQDSGFEPDGLQGAPVSWPCIQHAELTCSSYSV